MKKRFIIILTAIVLSFFAYGCKKSDVKNDSKTETTTEGKTETQSEEKSKSDEKQTETKEKDSSTTEKSDEKASEDSKVADEVSGTMIQEFDLSNHDAKESVRLWIPVAQSGDYQEISNSKVSVNGEDKNYVINEDNHGNKMIYVEFKPEDKERKVSYSFDVTRKEALRPEIKPETEFNPDDFKEYLSDSKLLDIYGGVKDKAIEITKGKETVLEKEQAIYDWIYENMERNNDVVGCGQGNVNQLLVSLDGKCTDIGSMFIALSRAVGVPARETFGVRLSKDETADMTKGQHCWVEYYQPGTGWFPIDIADVLKYILADKLDKSSEDALKLKDYFWGNFDAKRVGFTTGRDIVLNPKQAEEPLNQFGYPYLEIDGTAIDCYKPDEFIYKFTFNKAK